MPPGIPNPISSSASARKRFPPPRFSPRESARRSSRANALRSGTSFSLSGAWPTKSSASVPRVGASSFTYGAVAAARIAGNSASSHATSRATPKKSDAASRLATRLVASAIPVTTLSGYVTSSSVTTTTALCIQPPGTSAWPSVSARVEGNAAASAAARAKRLFAHPGLARRRALSTLLVNSRASALISRLLAKSLAPTTAETGTTSTQKVAVTMKFEKYGQRLTAYDAAHRAHSGTPASPCANGPSGTTPRLTMYGTQAR
mmetsp:Transcript_3084/g.12829  ORF Transcript_3084/g.12829 Transcript_3084/m.12829 type:complete len:261 (-) Transcript_3084:254-1036(-)